MSLLELRGVCKGYGRGSRERIALHDVSLELDAGELVGVWGRRHSGRSTLLRAAAGIEAPDSGVVRFERQDLNGRAAEALRGGVRYCRKELRLADGEHVIDQLVTSQLMRGASPSMARSRARDVLARTDAERCATLRPSELDGAEVVRVAIARALVRPPKLLVIDEPTLGVDLLERDQILLLLRSLADEGMAVLMSAGETSCLSGSDRALSMSEGELHGEVTPELAQVVPLHVLGRSASA